jgi:hypothetical protein
MKRNLTAILLALACVSAQAQSVWPEALGGAALGAGLGAAIGASTGNYYRDPCGSTYYSGGNAGQGAAIGAGVGLIAGALFGLANREAASNPQPAVWAYTPAPVPGYGYAPAYTPVPVQTVYAPPPPRPNYVVGGTLLGAASGALIGQGVNGKPGVGAAIGAGSGLVLGAVAEAATRNNPQPQAVPVENPPPPPAQSYGSQPIPGPPLAPVHYAVNAPRYQIPDAPRVPDAPTF